jgi:two-component system, NtrC family, response regulator AtoC
MDNKRVLIIEDNQVIAMVIKHCIMSMSAQIEIGMSTSAEEGETLFLGSQWDLIILGYQLPEKDGLELIREINPVMGASKWIMISGSNSSELRAEVNRLGGYNYLVEPFSLEDLKKVVGQVLHLQDNVKVSDMMTG